MTTLTARRLLTDLGSIEFPVLTVDESGRLADISSDPQALAAEQSTLTAAFFDVHTHGAVGEDVMSAAPQGFQKLQRFMAARGVAAYLPTTVTAPIDETLRALERLADAIEREPRPGEARPLGVHLEGPFLSHAKRGVHPAADLQPPSVELFERFRQAARDHIVLLTVAPEAQASATVSRTEGARAEGAAALIRHATAAGVRVSLGHTNATAEEALAAIVAGATSATHTFNAMRALDHRDPGVLGTVLDDDRVFAELICDGVHVAPAMVRLWLKAKGVERGILVTDAMSATGMPDGGYKLGPLEVTVAEGTALLASDLADGKRTLAGSTLTMDRAVANLQRFTGASLAQAVRLASDNPAAMLGRPELTRLAPGSMANLNRFDAEGKLVATYLGGQAVVRE